MLFAVIHSVMPRCALALLVATAAAAQVTTSQYDNARTGTTLRETALTPANVGSSRFGRLFTLAVDGDIYGQPLYLPNVDVPGKGRHNVVYVATEHDSGYAFDAEGNPAEPLWHVNFLNEKAGVTTIPADDARCPFIRPEIGIMPTPVIDLQTGTLYALARTKESQGRFSAGRYVQKLHALAITTGAEKFGGPVEIKAPGFGRLRELPRAGLLLANGMVYLTWASSCDVGPYHGWIMAYDAKTLTQKTVFNATPDAGEGGIWLGDAAPAADQQGHIYVPTGNGGFDNHRNWGDTLLKMSPDLKMLDYFTPSNQARLNQEDADLGSGGPVLLPDQPGPHPHLLLVGGKEGVLYALDRDDLGKYRPDEAQDPAGRARLKDGVYGARAYWFGHVFVQAMHDRLRDFAFENGQLLPSRSTLEQFIPPATPAVSSNGSRKRNRVDDPDEGVEWTGPSRRPARLRCHQHRARTVLE